MIKEKLIRPPHKQGLAPSKPVEARIVKDDKLGWIAIIDGRAWFLDWNGHAIPSAIDTYMTVVDIHEGKEHIGKDYEVKIVGNGHPSLLDILHDAEEFHNLPVVVMAMKDLATYGSDDNAIQCLRVDIAKIRQAKTEGGKKLYDYIKDTT